MHGAFTSTTSRLEWWDRCPLRVGASCGFCNNHSCRSPAHTGRTSPASAPRIAFYGATAPSGGSRPCRTAGRCECLPPTPHPGCLPVPRSLPMVGCPRPRQRPPPGGSHRQPASPVGADSCRSPVDGGWREWRHFLEYRQQRWERQHQHEHSTPTTLYLPLSRCLLRSCSCSFSPLAAGNVIMQKAIFVVFKARGRCRRIRADIYICQT